ncbi:MAG: purine-cytosine permease family protein [Candidatus Aminicenantia bacterium]
MEKEVLEDFSLKPVPFEERKTWIEIAMVWIGVAVVISAILRGMMVGMGLGSVEKLLLSYFLGEVILIGMMSLTGFIGSKEGISTPLVARFSFGEKGSWIMSICLGFAFMGWFGIQTGLFSETLKALLDINFPFPLISFLSGIIMMLPAVFGFRGLRALSLVAVPPMVLIFFYSAIKLKGAFLPPERLFDLAISHSPPYPTLIGECASLIAGGFIVGAVTSSDVFRYARPKWKDIILASTSAMAVSAGMQVVGSILAMKTGLYHEKLPKIIINKEFAGLGFLGFLAIAFAQWTTNDSNLYSSVLAFNNIFRWSRWKLAVIVGVLSSLLSAIGILQKLGLFLTILGIGIGPIGGIIIADYYLLKGKYRFSHAVNPYALFVYFVSFFIGWLTSGHPFKIKFFPFSIFAFNGILISIILYWVGMKILVNPEIK